MVADVQWRKGMNRLISFLIAATFAVPAFAQFSIGPRLSNYSTDFDTVGTKLKTGRQSAFGAVGGYRAGAFVLDFNYDHDTSNGINPTDIILAVGDYQRDHGEVTGGFSVTPFLDLQGGVRIDSVRVGGVAFFGNNIASDLDFEHQALTAGVRVHSADSAPAGFYLVARGYLGTAKFDNNTSGRVDSDTTGWRGEFGVPIRIGQSNWSVAPGIEYEHIQTKDFDVRLNTNRLFLNFVYTAK